jgi:hypothetical protein
MEAAVMNETTGRAMSEENVEIAERVRRLCAAYSRRDWDAYFADTDPEFEWDTSTEPKLSRPLKAPSSALMKSGSRL